MDYFIVEGGVPLRGEVTVSGSKNAALPLMAASLLCEGVTIIDGVPDLMDIRTMAMVLRVLGAEVDLQQKSLIIDASGVNKWVAPYDLVRKMRASFYVLGPLVARFGKARVSLPGGCALGPRPVDLHLKALRKMGCDITLEEGYVVASAPRLYGARITLDVASVGATGNILMAAVAANGTTIIENAAREPEIADLARFLVAMGAQISGIGESRMEINGPTTLKPVRWKTIPDRIESATYLIASLITSGEIVVRGADAEHLTLVLEKLSEVGAKVEVGGDESIIDHLEKNISSEAEISGSSKQSTLRDEGRSYRESGAWIKLNAPPEGITSVDITTAVYPGFPTDLQPLWSALMCLARGDSVITDTIYPERFTHVPELQRLGGDLRQELNSVYIRGVPQLRAAPLMCSDIRGGAALVIAALAAEGTSRILRVYHIDRGYERMEEKLQGLGARLWREKSN